MPHELCRLVYYSLVPPGSRRDPLSEHASPGLRAARSRTDRARGVHMAVGLCVAGAAPAVFGDHTRRWVIGVGIIVLAVAVVTPGPLVPLTRAWERLALVLSSAFVLFVVGLIFILLIVPTAILGKLFGRDPLRLRIDRGTASYWTRRDDLRTASDMRNQY